MNAEDALRAKMAHAICAAYPEDDWRGCECAQSGEADACQQHQVEADAALKALGVPLPVLAWCAANPEAAKGLAEDKIAFASFTPCDEDILSFMRMLHANMPEVDRPASLSDFSDEQWSRARNACEFFIACLNLRIAQEADKAAASTSVLSGKAQGGKPDDGVRYNHEGEPWPT